MIDLGTTFSTVKPSAVDIKEAKVFVASDITEVHEEGNDGQPGFDGYSYNLKEYDKDEYIKLIQDKNTGAEKSITDLQMALADVYEMILSGGTN